MKADLLRLVRAWESLPDLLVNWCFSSAITSPPRHVATTKCHYVFRRSRCLNDADLDSCGREGINRSR